MLAVCVDFEIDIASLDAFPTIIEKNALDLLADEGGCHQFNIAQDPQNPTKIFLYELYDDAVAFELHKKGSHYFEFNDAISGVVYKNRSVCFRKLTTNLGLNVRRFILSTLKIFAVFNKPALAET
jgi:(4S)-4-hydroxy-5-phosphonooxypentane-2,3-dione isomerase